MPHVVKLGVCKGFTASGFSLFPLQPTGVLQNIPSDGVCHRGVGGGKGDLGSQAPPCCSKGSTELPAHGTVQLLISSLTPVNNPSTLFCNLDLNTVIY